MALGTEEVLLVLLVFFLLVGPKKLPLLARKMGNFYREIKDAFKDKNDELKG